VPLSWPWWCDPRVRRVYGTAGPTRPAATTNVDGGL